MPVDYGKIRDENRAFKDPKVRRLVRDFIVESYADRAHFILELLQNAEDAFERRDDTWSGDRTVSFKLSRDQLRVSHHGEPFNENDVRGISGIGESTKSEELTSIGRFGIGFKSVYRFTDRPEVHSGDEDFAIEDFVFPTAVPPIDRDPDETVILMPLHPDNVVEYNDKIAQALEGLDVRSFLFLRKIEELRWEVEGCDWGHYVREVAIEDEIARRVNVIGHVKDLIGEETDVNEEWIVFSRRVQNDGKEAGHVEIAFYVDRATGTIRRLGESKLVVYFPTVVETRLGFLVQGPYRTTPNRDNVPEDDEWNQGLVDQTCVLLKDALIWLRDRKLLNAEVLRCLPLRSFPGDMVEPLFDATKELLSTERLLPKFNGGYVAANRSLMGDSEALRSLFSEQQLSEIYGLAFSWLSGDFTIDRNPGLRRYLMSELGFSETTVESILRDIRPEFLESQSDGWMIRLYEFLATQRALRPQLRRLPLIRLHDGTHVAAEIGGQPSAYFPTGNKTDFPTVKEDVCISAGAQDFLESLGIQRPDLIDDIIAHVLPKYQSENSRAAPNGYEVDVDRILRAYTEAQNHQRKQRLIDELSTTAWVMAVDINHGRKQLVRPTDLCLATERVRNVFSGITGVLLVDESFECLSRDNLSDLLTRCGANADFVPTEIENSARFSTDELETMRIDTQRNAGNPISEDVQDWRVRGLGVFLSRLDALPPRQQIAKARLLWESMADWREMQTRGTYSWSHRRERSCQFDSEFIEQLSNTPWIPGPDGELKRPEEVDFDVLEWAPNPTMQSRLPFKPSEIKLLAQKLDFEPDMLDLLKRRGLTTISSLREFGIVDDQFDDGAPSSQTETEEQSDRFEQLFLDAMTQTPTDAVDSPVIMPSGGPKTAESAKHDTQRSLGHGRQGRRVTREVTRFAPSAASRGLDEKFKNMLSGDYGRRCQICGKTFQTRKGDLQVFADHVVAPSESTGTNHFGNLMSLCGWHYALISYGQWVLLDPITEEPSKALETDQDIGGIIGLLEKAETEFDNDGNEFITLPVRFWNIYSDWRSNAEHFDEEIRFSLPHRTYLVELLKT